MHMGTREKLIIQDLIPKISKGVAFTSNAFAWYRDLGINLGTSPNFCAVG
jgi:hypothetical protein